MKNDRYKSLFKQAAIVAVVIILAYTARRFFEIQYDKKTSSEDAQSIGRELSYAEMVQESNQILRIFKTQYPEAEVLLACEEDVTDDGCLDLVVICRMGNLTRTIVAIDSGNGKDYTYSTPIPAPIENQKIQFNNIDREGEIEIVITGEKNGAVGYAIYRIIDGEPVDLFGEGMEDCC